MVAKNRTKAIKTMEYRPRGNPDDRLQYRQIAGYRMLAVIL